MLLSSLFALFSLVPAETFRIYHGEVDPPQSGNFPHNVQIFYHKTP